MENRDIVRLLHIREAIARIEASAAIGHERFSDDSMSQDAVLWQLDVICEALKHLSPDFPQGHPVFASDRLREVQQALEHNFLEFDLELAWDATQQRLPELKRAIAVILEKEQRAENA